MRNSPFIDFQKCFLSNDLWSEFISKIGIIKAQSAVSQAFDLQIMQGNASTLPVLILDTCGIVLVDSQVIKNHIGLSHVEQGMLLIYSNKLKAIQLLIDI